MHIDDRKAHTKTKRKDAFSEEEARRMLGVGNQKTALLYISDFIPSRTESRSRVPQSPHDSFRAWTARSGSELDDSGKKRAEQMSLSISRYHARSLQCIKVYCGYHNEPRSSISHLGRQVAPRHFNVHPQREGKLRRKNLLRIASRLRRLAPAAGARTCSRAGGLATTAHLHCLTDNLRCLLRKLEAVWRKEWLEVLTSVTSASPSARCAVRLRCHYGCLQRSQGIRPLHGRLVDCQLA